MLRISLLSAFIITLSLTSCSDSTHDYKNGDTIFFPDTTAFLRSWKMNEKVFRDEVYIADAAYQELPLDTLELTYGMCDCPDWHDYTKGDIDCRECTEFYIEAADASLQLPDAFLVNGNTVRFYGVLIPGFNLPQNRAFTTPDPEPWTVLRYYGYEVVKPYKVWGSALKEFQESGDTLSRKVIVQVGK
jgi:hypothetical protein